MKCYRTSVLFTKLRLTSNKELKLAIISELQSRGIKVTYCRKAGK